MKNLRMVFSAGLVGSLLLGAAVVSAAPGASGAEPQCSGEHGEGKGKLSKQERFKKHDANGDGFLTAAEVGERRWEHMKVADANNDAKVSLAELKKAHADGKMKKHGKGKGEHGKGKA